MKMKKDDVENALPSLIDAWAQATSQPMPPDGQYHYSFLNFWNWVQQHHWSYTQFRAVPGPQYVMEMWFDRLMKQAWRN